MTGSNSRHGLNLKIYRIAMLWFYPTLREFPPDAWEATLAAARDAEFSAAERVGVVGGVAVVAWLLGVEPSVLAAQPRFIVHLLQFVFALPLLAAIVGPIYVRRTRRGLERELARRKSLPGGETALSNRTEA